MDVLIKPIITEKATSGSELQNCYSFLVNTKANKVEIKKAVEVAYGVSVNKVRTLNYGPEEKQNIQKLVSNLVKPMPLKRLWFKLSKGMS